MVRALMEKVSNMWEHLGIVSREVETLGKKQKYYIMEIL